MSASYLALAQFAQTWGLAYFVGVFLLVAIQWFAFLRNGLGRPSTWKGRAYSAPANTCEMPIDCELEPVGWVKPTN